MRKAAPATKIIRSHVKKTAMWPFIFLIASAQKRKRIGKEAQSAVKKRLFPTA
jgi:hypothetical protein